MTFRIRGSPSSSFCNSSAISFSHSSVSAILKVSCSFSFQCDLSVPCLDILVQKIVNKLRSIFFGSIFLRRQSLLGDMLLTFGQMILESPVQCVLSFLASSLVLIKSKLLTPERQSPSYHKFTSMNHCSACHLQSFVFFKFPVLYHFASILKPLTIQRA